MIFCWHAVEISVQCRAKKKIAKKTHDIGIMQIHPCKSSSNCCFVSTWLANVYKINSSQNIPKSTSQKPLLLVPVLPCLLKAITWFQLVPCSRPAEVSQQCLWSARPGHSAWAAKCQMMDPLACLSRHAWVVETSCQEILTVHLDYTNLSTEHFQNMSAELGMWDELHYFQINVLSVAFYIYIQLNFSLAAAAL